MPALLGLILDVEGVIVDTEPIWDSVQEQFLRKRNRTYDRSAVKPMLTGRSLKQSTHILMEQYDIAGDVDELSEERSALMMQQLQAGVHFVAGFLEFYDLVKRRYTIAIATSLDPKLLGIVDRHLNLSALVDGRIATSGHVPGRGKPLPDVFLYAAELLRLPPPRCWAIEDSPAGVEAANRAGMLTVAITTTHPRRLLAKADLIVDRFADIELDAVEQMSVTIGDTDLS